MGKIIAFIFSFPPHGLADKMTNFVDPLYLISSQQMSKLYIYPILSRLHPCGIMTEGSGGSFI